MRIVIPEDRPKHERQLEDGAMLTLSPILKTDREFFEKGLDEMSLENRFARFGAGKSSLSNSELDYLTDVDQRHHVAWGAAIDEEVAGVGRYIVSDDGVSAEVAVTVLDHMQQRGVGRALFEALIAVARHDGVHEFSFETQADNEAVMSLVRGVDISPLVTGDVVERVIRISDLPASADDDSLVAVIEEVRA
jgi:GNAT superfamily N-acetyltransferase